MNITISNDAVVEQQETFGVRLSVSDQSVTLTQDEATVIISDVTGKVKPYVHKDFLWHPYTTYV